jgi:hypothetical protein
VGPRTRCAGGDALVEATPRLIRRADHRLHVVSADALAITLEDLDDGAV